MYFVVFGGRVRKPVRREWKFIQMAAEVDLWLPADCSGTGVSDFRSGWNKICGTAWIMTPVLWAHREKVKPGTSNLPFSHSRKSTPHGGQLANKRDDNFGPFFFVNITAASAGGNTSVMMNDSAAQRHEHTNPKNRFMLFFYCSGEFFFSCILKLPADL